MPNPVGITGVHTQNDARYAGLEGGVSDHNATFLGEIEGKLTRHLGLQLDSLTALEVVHDRLIPQSLVAV